MANEKFKFVLADSGGNKVTYTENHPKVDASKQDMTSAMEGLGDMIGGTGVEIILNSDTSVWKAS